LVIRASSCTIGASTRVGGCLFVHVPGQSGGSFDRMPLTFQHLPRRLTRSPTGGWQLDKEWDEQQRKAQIPSYLVEDGAEAGTAAGTTATAAPPPEGDETVDPYACPICQRPLKQPVRTKCAHAFCERCALKQFVKTQKCFTCGEGTGGIFVPAPKAFREALAAHLATRAAAEPPGAPAALMPSTS
jgi:hypothetical protein